MTPLMIADTHTDQHGTVLRRILHTERLALGGAVLALILFIVSFSTPGWIVMEITSASGSDVFYESLAVGVWYLRLCGRDACVTKVTPLTHTPNESASLSRIGNFVHGTAYHTESVVVVILSGLAVIVWCVQLAVADSCRRRKLGLFAMFSELTVGNMAFYMTFNHIRILLLLSAATFGPDTRCMMSTPYSVIFAVIGELVAYVAVLVWAYPAIKERAVNSPGQVLSVHQATTLVSSPLIIPAPQPYR